MKRRSWTARTAVVASAAAAAITLIMATAGCTNGGPAPETSPSATRTSVAAPDPTEPASRHFAVLARRQTAADALPDDDAFEPEEIVPNSQRFVVEQDGTRYWIAAAKGGGVCLIARNGDPNSAENWSVSAGPEVGAATVVTSMIDDAGRQTALVSDGFSATGPTDLHELATNVWVGNVDLNPRENAAEG